MTDDRRHIRPGPQVERLVRELQRRDDDELQFDLTLTHRGKDVRMTVPVAVHEIYPFGEPKWVDGYYLPDERLFVVDMPPTEDEE